MNRPRIAVVPSDVRPWVKTAVEEGGAEIVGDIADADALVCTDAWGVDAAADLREVVNANPQLQWVQLPWAGVEQLAAAGVFDNDRMWTCAKGVYAKPVAEHALGLALAGLRGMKRYAREETWGDRSTGVSLVGGRVTI